MAPRQPTARTTASGQRRRRRRGGRRRRKASGRRRRPTTTVTRTVEHGEAAAGQESRSSGGKARNGGGNDDCSGNEDGESGEGGTSRRRRRRRRAGDADDGDDDPENTVVRVRKPRSAEDEITSVSGSTRLEAKKQRRREGREAGRRRPPILTEAEFLARRESVDRVMVDPPARATAPRSRCSRTTCSSSTTSPGESQTSLIGNVYLGRVQNVLPSMEAAFVDIGNGRNAVLYAGEVNWDAAGAKDGRPRKIEHALKSGQPVLVQVTKDPIGHKGARLTSQISLPGRFLVYVPGRRDERHQPQAARHRAQPAQDAPQGDRPGQRRRHRAHRGRGRQRGGAHPRRRAAHRAVGGHREEGRGRQAPRSCSTASPTSSLKVVRDIFNEDFTQARRPRRRRLGHRRGLRPARRARPGDRLERCDDAEGDVFAAYRIDEQIAKALDRKVWLPSGGSLVIDRTEAMTVVDVNTGKFTGSGGNLEETVTKNNLEAAEEIVRQLRLRDIGGIIVVDFIDMVLETNRDLVLRRLIECLGRDRTKHQVAEVTSLGLVQMTRKRIGTGPARGLQRDVRALPGPRRDHHERAGRGQGAGRTADDATAARGGATRLADSGDGRQARDGDDQRQADAAKDAPTTAPPPANAPRSSRRWRRPRDRPAAREAADRSRAQPSRADRPTESSGGRAESAEARPRSPRSRRADPLASQRRPEPEAASPTPEPEPRAGRDRSTPHRGRDSVRRLGARRAAGPPAAAATAPGSTPVAAGRRRRTASGSPRRRRGDPGPSSRRPHRATPRSSSDADDEGRAGTRPGQDARARASAEPRSGLDRAEALRRLDPWRGPAVPTSAQLPSTFRRIVDARPGARRTDRVVDEE